jgi:hypothetical protein
MKTKKNIYELVIDPENKIFPDISTTFDYLFRTGEVLCELKSRGCYVSYDFRFMLGVEVSMLHFTKGYWADHNSGYFTYLPERWRIDFYVLSNNSDIENCSLFKQITIYDKQKAFNLWNAIF